MTSKLASLIALPYELARKPVALIDHGLASRLPESSLPRVTLDRAIGSADKLAGTVLRNPDIAQRGVERIERSSTLMTAARLEQEAAVRRERAQETLESGKQEAAAKREAAQERVATGLDEAEAVAARTKQQAAERAAQQAADRQAAADERAAERAAAIEERERREEAAAEARKQAAQQQAKSELVEAREKREAAARERADAERLSDLAEAKKQQRKDD